MHDRDRGRVDDQGHRARVLGWLAVAGLASGCLVWAFVFRTPHEVLPVVVGVLAAAGALVSPLWPTVGVASGLVDFALYPPSLGLAVSSAVLALRARRPVVWLAGVFAVALLAAAWSGGWDLDGWWDAARSGVMIVLVPGVVGLAVRARLDVEQLRRERDAERLARAELDRQNAEISTRLQIAQSMHDGLGHQLSLLVLGLSGVDGLIGSDDDRARSLLHDVQDIGRAATTQLRDDVLGTRGTGGASSAADDGDDTDVVGPVRTIVRRARSAGIDVDLTAPRVLHLSGSDGGLVERSITEGLTNVAKHAPGAQADVVLASSGHRIELTITNGPPPGPAPETPASGTGLRALDDAVRLTGGRLDTGPLPDGGFRLRMTLPDHRCPPTPEEHP